MQVIASVVILLALFALSEADRPPKEYLPVSSPHPFEEQEIKWIIKQVESLGTDDIDEIDDYLRKASNTAQQLVEGTYDPSLPDETNVSGYEKSRVLALSDMLSTFLNLIATSEPVACSAATIQQYLDIIGVGFGTSQSFLDSLDSGSSSQNGVFFKYIKFHENQNLQHCVKSADTKLDESLNKIPDEAEADIDELVSLGKTVRDQDRLYELAQKVDFTQGEFEAKKMLKLAKNHMNEQDDNRNKPLMTLVSYLLRVCPSLRIPLADIFDAYNFARALSPSLDTADHSARFRKLNEYSRICNQVLNPSTRELVIDSIQSKLSDEHWYNKLMRKGSMGRM